MRNKHSVVIVACGNQAPRKIGFTGEAHAISSLHFLRSLKLGTWSSDFTDKHIGVIGAGDVAMDVARECIRLGADAVTAVDIQRPTASPAEILDAQKLGVRILYPKMVDRFEPGNLFFAGGDSIRADMVITAIGELPELSFAGDNFIISRDAFTTNLPFVYAIGDVVTSGLVTHSIGMGRHVAEMIHHTLRGIAQDVESASVVQKRRINLLYFQEPNELSTVLDDCFSCGTCIQCDICVEACPREAITREGESFRINSEICSGCGVCVSMCPRGAIIMVEACED